MASPSEYLDYGRQQGRYIPNRHADVPPHTPGDSIFLEAQPAPRLNNVRGGASTAETPRMFPPPPPPAAAPMPWQPPLNTTGEKWPTPTSFMLPPPPPPPFGIPPPPPGFFPFPGSAPPPPPPHFSGMFAPPHWPPPPVPYAGDHHMPYMGVPADPSMPWLGPAVAGPSSAARFEDPYQLAGRAQRHDVSDVESRRQASASALEEAKIRSLVQRAKEHFGIPGLSSRSTSATSDAQGGPQKRSSSAASAGKAAAAPERPSLEFSGMSLREQRLARINSRRQSAVEERKQEKAKTKPASSRFTAAPLPQPAPSREARRVADTSSRGRVVAAAQPAQEVRRRTNSSQLSASAGPTGRRGVTVKALKGYAPDLSHVLRNGLPSEQQRLRNYERRTNDTTTAATAQATTTPQRAGRIKYVPGIGSPSYEPFVKAAQGDPRAAMYLEGIEDLYKKLRQSYDEFQRNPEQFLKAPAASAIKKAVAGDTVEVVHEASNVRSVHVPLNVQFPEAVPASSETVKLREELDRLEIQWQRLSDVRGGSSTPMRAADGFASPISTRQGVAERISSMSKPPGPAGLTGGGSFSPDSVLEFVREKKQGVSVKS